MRMHHRYEAPVPVIWVTGTRLYPHNTYSTAVLMITATNNQKGMRVFAEDTAHTVELARLAPKNMSHCSPGRDKWLLLIEHTAATHRHVPSSH